MADKEWLTPRRALKKEATAMLKADKEDRIEAKRPSADNVAEEQEYRRARALLQSPDSANNEDKFNALLSRRRERAEAIDAQKEAIAQHKQRAKEARAEIRAVNKTGGGGGSDTREMQLGADLDPKAMMKKEGYKKGGAVKSASARADGCAIRGKTRA